MSGPGRVVRAGVGRRRVQTLVLILTTTLAVTASVLAVGLLVASSAPFQRAFDRLSGAHLIGAYDPARVSMGQLTDTARATGVTAAAGPFGSVSLRPRAVAGRAPSSSGPGIPAGVDLPPVTIVGRDDPGGTVDRLDLVDGRWVTGPGEIVWAAGPSFTFRVGERVTFNSAPGSPTFTVVGVARSIGQSAQAWVSAQQLTTLSGAEGPTAYQMLYRFANAATEADITADRAVLAAAVPAGALTGTASYLTIRSDAERSAGTFAPFVVAFGVLGLFMSVLIIGIVVGGAVSSATRRIGILKSLGFTPAQVVRAYVAQALIPATIGAALGVVLGNLAAIPVLQEEGDAFGTGVPRLETWVSIVVPVAALVAVAVAAVVPALRAGRLRTIDAIAVGRATAAGRGRHVRRLLGGLPGPRPLSLGLGSPFARPGRSAMIAAAVALGALGVTFGTGLAMSLSAIQEGLNRRNAGDVIVHTVGPRPAPGSLAPTSPDDTAIRAAIQAQPGTSRYFTSREAEVSVTGLATPTRVLTFDGDTSWANYQIISGRWYSGAGEAVVPTGFLNATGMGLGDTITITSDGRSATVRIVGEVLDLSDDGLNVITDLGSVAALRLSTTPGSGEYHIQAVAGTDIASYVDSLNAALEPLQARAEVNTADISSIVVAMDTLTAMLTLMLITVAGLGVLNTVVLDTRERVHDLGVFKALGMSPRQTIAMVLTSVSAIGVLAGLLGVPAGIAVHDWILPAMGRAAGTRIPQADIDVYHLPIVVPLALGGLVIALLGALLPAGWAARTSTTKALRTE